MAAKNLTREQAFAEMAKGRRCRPPGWSPVTWVTQKNGVVVDEKGDEWGAFLLRNSKFATGWRLLKDLPPRAELVRELEEVRAKLEATQRGLQRAPTYLETLAMRERLAKSDADLATTKAALAEALARPVPRFKVGDEVTVPSGTRYSVTSADASETHYRLVHKDGTTGYCKESHLSPAPTAKPEPAWVGCGAAEAVARLRGGSAVRSNAMVPGLSLQLRGEDVVLVDPYTNTVDIGSGWVATLLLSTETTGWQWQEVGQ